MIYNGINYRELFNGLLVTSHTGRPSAVPPGYMRTADEYIFAPILDRCKHRTERNIKVSCCRRIVKWCNHFEKRIDFKDCKVCTYLDR